jgi:hypothetical protein
MGTRLIDRWTDTTAFRLMLFVGGLVAVPVLMLGLPRPAGSCWKASGSLERSCTHQDTPMTA